MIEHHSMIDMGITMDISIDMDTILMIFFMSMIDTIDIETESGAWGHLIVDTICHPTTTTTVSAQLGDKFHKNCIKRI
jgi:hypothetical protein